jgi:hypothetical protein
MSRTYKIVNIPGLSGLHVVGETNGDVVDVKEIINVGIVIGDRLLRYPIPSSSVFIAKDNLEEIDNISAREFSAENPYGEFKYEGRFEKNDLTIAHAVYEKAITITIYEDNKQGGQKTLYTGNFFENRVDAAQIIDELLHGNMDSDDVIFELKNLEGN